MIRLFSLLFLVPALALALSGKIDASVTAIPVDAFTLGSEDIQSKILADCMGSQIVVCNKVGEEIAVGYTSSATPPATSNTGIRYYLPDGQCRTSLTTLYYTDVYVQVTGSASASSGVVTADCR